MKLIIFLVLMVSHRVLSQTRLVVNTTCLELAKPSNQQLRLNCSNPSRYYHCLLDETFTKEFEVCTVFMWIHEGKCAYFNTYGTGNIDLRMCKNFTHLFCPTLQYKSVENTKYPICYVKKNTSKKTPTTGSFQVASELTSDRLHSTLSPFLDTTEKKYDETRTVLPILFGIIVPFLSVFLMCSICMCWKATKKGREIGIKEKKDDNLEQKKPLLKNEGSQTFRHENEDDTDNTPEGQKGNEEEPAKNTIESDYVKSDVAKENEEESTEIYHEVDENFRKDNTKNSPEGQKGDQEEPAKNILDSESLKSDVAKENEEESTEICHEVDVNFRKDDTDKEKSTESSSGSGFPPGKSDNEEENEEESTDVFDDTIESLQRKAPPTDEDSRELCTELCNLLGEEGLKLTQEVMAATISGITGKSVETLLNDLKEEEERKLKEALPEEHKRIFESKEERKTSFYVLYGLHGIFLDKELCPKSGWGNPVRGKSLGIGDDIERLYRIQTIFQKISKPANISVKGYTRLLDIMREALIGLDEDVDSKEEFKAIVQKLKQIKNRSLTQIILKQISDISKLWSKTKSNQGCEEEAK